MELVIHPTAAYAVPLTHCKPGQSGLKPKAVRKPKDITCEELRQLVAATGLKALKAHTKAELRAMLKSGVQVRPAAYDRANAQRRAKRAAAKQG